MMGPTMVRFSLAKPGEDMNAVWGAEVKNVEGMDLAQLAEKIVSQAEAYTALLTPLADTDYREVIQGFGTPMTRGAFLVTSALASHAAYRTQLFCYLKACGRTELSTANLWRGVDAPPKA